jgi:hypothetical protein
MTMMFGNRLLLGLLGGLFCVAGCGEARKDQVGGSSPSDQPADLQQVATGRAAEIIAIQRDAPGAYAVYGANAYNPAQRLSAVFDSEAIEVRHAARPAAVARLELAGFGLRGRVEAAPPVTSRDVEGNRVVYERRTGAGLALREWYLNGPLGLEQGFDIPSAPMESSQEDSALVFSVELAGLTARPSSGGAAADFVDERGTPVLRYGELHAFDATGRTLPVELAVAGATLSLTVVTEGAVFPVVVDPLIWPQLPMLQANDIGQFHNFGDSVNINGGRAVVGAPRANSGAITSQDGAAYIFDLNVTTGQWSQVAKVVSSSPAASDNFGSSVATEGAFVAVGASGEEDPTLTDQGFAYVFERQTDGSWPQPPQRLTPSTPSGRAFFGSSMGMSPGRLIISALGQTEGAVTESGAVYLFERPPGGPWGEVAKLLASDASTFHRFGINSRISGDRAIVGANLDDELGASAGAAYIFERQASGVWGVDCVPPSSGRCENQKLLANDGDAGDWFGVTVSIDGDYAVIGARNDEAGGSAYVFKRDASGVYNQTAKLVPSDPNDTALFGTNVAVSGDRAIVSAFRHDGAGSDAGAVYFFARQPDETWVEEQRLFSNPAEASSEFGEWVSLSGNWALVGAPSFDAAGLDAGAAFIFEGVNPGALGSACTEGQRCGSGHCVDGVCCDTDCAAACHSCVASQTGGADGTCAPVSGLTDADGGCNNGYCEAGQCLPRKADGEACGALGECASRNCIDGVCCDATCSGQCEACDVTGSIGTCTPVDGAPRGGRAACIDNGDECAGTCDGVDRSACTYPVGSTACGVPACADGAAQTSSCDGAGVCAADPPVQCSPFACGATACETSCTTDPQCGEGFICEPETGNCVPEMAAGATCNEDRTRVIDPDGTPGRACHPYFCVNGVCDRSCLTTQECQEGYACHRDRNVCFQPDPENFVGETIGCACALGQKDRSGSGAAWVLALGLSAWFARRRRA